MSEAGNGTNTDAGNTSSSPRTTKLVVVTKIVTASNIQAAPSVPFSSSSPSTSALSGSPSTSTTSTASFGSIPATQMYFEAAASSSPSTSDPSRSSTTSTASFVSVSTPATQSTPIPAVTTGVAVLDDAHRHKISSGAIVGIVVAVVVLLCAIVAIFWRIRRRRLRSHAQIFNRDAEENRAGRTISPFTLLVEDRSISASNTTDADSDTRSISSSTTTRQRLETQLRAATEKRVELEELAEGSTAGDPNAGRGGEREFVSPTQASTAPAPNSDLVAELRAARAQINMLSARMNDVDSVLGMGMREPPPQYA
ncbi:hypothetical protein MSAN_01098300 [Mycena sanguinolenta]|uniref:Uncharacterized protein n=1 Tax=Mycena sanguinolenta TaxID=230812 RepID=A0A8H7DA76_9AGAR|nr:hypothetical protein MSAN_01098300 [Mycena sanguinolenta]